MDLFDQLKTDAVSDTSDDKASSPSPTSESEMSKSPVSTENDVSPPKEKIRATLKLANNNHSQPILKRCRVRINRKELQRNLAILDSEKSKRKLWSTANPAVAAKKPKPLTKAQKKHFNPSEPTLPTTSKFRTAAARKLINVAKKNNEKNVRNLRVRVKRLNNTDVKQRESKKRNKKHTKSQNQTKRASPKQAKNNSAQNKPHFFIKLQDALAKSAEKIKQVIETKTLHREIIPKNAKKQNKKKSHSGVAKVPLKAKTKTSKKLKRSDLERKFGKQCFRSYVKIKRCKHPLMVIFESNEQARRLKALEKKNKRGKNLTVSFKENVEIFGATSSTSDTSDNDELANLINAASISSPKTETIEVKKKDENAMDAETAGANVKPALLKKVENEKLKKERKKKGILVPLKDSYASNSKKERFKQANEKLPSKGFRHLNTADDDDDDECEYIVPNDVPSRRSSNSSLINTSDTSTNGEQTPKNVNNDDSLHSSASTSGNTTKAVKKNQSVEKQLIENDENDRKGALTPLSPPPTNVAEIGLLAGITSKLSTETNQKLLTPSNGISAVVDSFVTSNDVNKKVDLIEEPPMKMMEKDASAILSAEKKDANTSALTTATACNEPNTCDAKYGNISSTSSDKKIESKTSDTNQTSNASIINTTNEKTIKNPPTTTDRCFTG